MCVFSLIGLTFFGTAGILLIVYGYTQHGVQITVMVLCLLATLFFLLDITMVLAWVSRLSVNPRISERPERFVYVFYSLVGSGRENAPSANDVAITKERNICRVKRNRSHSRGKKPKWALAEREFFLISYAVKHKTKLPQFCHGVN